MASLPIEEALSPTPRSLDANTVCPLLLIPLKVQEKSSLDNVLEWMDIRVLFSSLTDRTAAGNERGCIISKMPRVIWGGGA
jgi:hypothetical protein